MSEVNYGADYSYAQSRLNNSVVMLAGKPVLIHKVGAGGKVTYSDPFSGNMDTDSLKNFDLRPVLLGYTNSKWGALYSFRMPSRTYRQGLTDSNFKIGGGALSYCSPQVAKTILGDYTSLGQCVENVLCKEIDSQAFSRNFALKHISDKTEEMSLWFKGREVGISTWNSGAKAINYKFNSGLDFLNGMMEEALHAQK